MAVQHKPLLVCITSSHLCQWRRFAFSAHNRNGDMSFIMREIATPRPLLTTILLLLLAGCEDKSAVKTPVLGEPFPQVTLKALDGSQLTLAELHGKLVILHIWATWCPPCRKEMPGLQRLSQKLDPNKFSLIALSVDDDVNLLREFLHKYGVGFARHIDPEGKIANDRLGLDAYPATFLIDRDGILLRQMSGQHDWDNPAMIALLHNGYDGKLTESGAYR